MPGAVRPELVRRARQAGKSLQQYLAPLLAAIAGTPSLDDVLDRIERGDKGHLTGRDASVVLSAERARP